MVKEEISKKSLSILDKLMKFGFIYILLCGILLLDVYCIIIFKKGVLEIDIFNIFKGNIIYFILFILLFGIILNGTSILLFALFYKLLYRFIFNPNNNLEYININILMEIAIDNKDTFLMDYVKTSKKQIRRNKMNYQIMYALLISIIINLFENESILRKVINIIKFGNDIKTKILLLIILLPVLLLILSSIYYSITLDEEKIYYKNNEIKK
jgi:hypothetical protein